MVKVCLKCERREPITDDPFEACEGCGVNEWAIVEVPLKDLKFTKQDREFLKVNRIAQE